MCDAAAIRLDIAAAADARRTRGVVSDEDVVSAADDAALSASFEALLRVWRTPPPEVCEDYEKVSQE